MQKYLVVSLSLSSSAVGCSGGKGGCGLAVGILTAVLISGCMDVKSCSEVKFWSFCCGNWCGNSCSGGSNGCCVVDVGCWSVMITIE